MLEQIRTVLSHTTHPGNIGAAARALKVMGLSQLTLVNPKDYPCAEATQRASRATDILADAAVVGSMEEAVADCRLIVGTSARTRTLPSKLITPRELAEKIKHNPSRLPVAILFGTENSGLTNEELQICHYHVCIPTNPEYSSLNIASAVQLVAYEMRLALCEQPLIVEQRQVESDLAISREQFSGLLEHFEKIMLQTGYLVLGQERLLPQRMNRLFNKADLTVSELNILRGFLSSMEKHVKRIEQNH
ncbi:MAG: RNA methyltransferase [Kangiellaceae bacterium]|nr:RNA methyltransferase [Kangiellaceae bacterium]